MASSIARWHIRTTTTAVVESRNMAAMLQLIGWQKHAPSVYIGSMPSFLSGIFEEKTHPYQQTIAEVDLPFLIRVGPESKNLQPKK